jgi:osmoprotectant transport system permease protein
MRFRTFCRQISCQFTLHTVLRLCAAALWWTGVAVLYTPPSLALVQEKAKREITIGSKTFTESVILGEVLTQRLQQTVGKPRGLQVKHIPQLGGTRVLWNALLAGSVDAYPEYTGTIIAEILGTTFANKPIPSDNTLRAELARRGIGMTRSLGFANTYALGMKPATADRLKLRTISDLARHPTLHLAFSNEFMDRQDGWRGLKAAYGLVQTDVQGLDHDIAYRALDAGSIDATELYSTDAEIAEYDLRILDDDRHFFADYRAVVLYRLGIFPEAAQTLALLEGTISQDAMIRMNADVKIRRMSESTVAAAFVRQLDTSLSSPTSVSTPVSTPAANPESPLASLLQRVMQRTGEHLTLVAVSLLAAILVAVPLGILAASWQQLGFLLLGAVGVIQTIPSLALLVLMIPLLGIGFVPAVAALFLYSMLPIVRGTATGLTGIPAHLRESAEVLGLPYNVRLWRIDLPLAVPSILSGIKTAAVINVGTATLGALIGAGGHGQPILTGIRLANTAQILEGAVPAALLALLVQGAFEVLERVLVRR